MHVNTPLYNRCRNPRLRRDNHLFSNSYRPKKVALKEAKSKVIFLWGSGEGKLLIIGFQAKKEAAGYLPGSRKVPKLMVNL